MTGRRNRAPTAWMGAGVAYVAMVFPVAFAFGTARVLLVAPRVGETVAVLLEAPLILAVSWLASRVCVRRFQVPPAVAARLAMGATAFLLLMLAELGLGLGLFGQTFEAVLAGFGSAPGAIGLAAQLGFALVPFLQIRRRG